MNENTESNYVKRARSDTSQHKCLYFLSKCYLQEIQKHTQHTFAALQSEAVTLCVSYIDNKIAFINASATQHGKCKHKTNVCQRARER